MVCDGYRSKVGLSLVLLIGTILIGAIPIWAYSIRGHNIVFFQKGIYASHPKVFQGPGDQLWLRFGTNTLRTHYGSGPGGTYKSQWVYSPDGGKTWFAEGKDKEFRGLSYKGTSLQLSNETYLHVYFAVDEVVNKEKADELRENGVLIKKKWNDDRFSVSYRVGLNRWNKKGVCQGSPLRLPPVAQISSNVRGRVLSDGVVLIPADGKQGVSDLSKRAWVIRSEDNGETWQLITLAYDGFHEFEEPDVIQCPDGTIIAMMRCERNRLGKEGEGYLWKSVSKDGGKTWSLPEKTLIWGYPPRLLQLKDGRLLCTYGYRKPPYGIRACLSNDNGKTWDIDHEIVLRDDGLAKGKKAWPGDLGYPSTVQLEDGSLFTVYYFDLGDGITHIAGTHWSFQDDKFNQKLPTLKDQK